MQFEWDEHKNRSNQAKHGLSFEVAIRAFADPAALFEYNTAVAGEDREQVIGRIDGSLLIVLVVYTVKEEANEEIYRIITARKASPSERQRYEEATD